MVLQNKYVITAWQFFVILLTTVLTIILPLNYIFNLFPSAEVGFVLTLASILFLIDIVYSVYFEKTIRNFVFDERSNYFRFVIIFDLLAVIPFWFLFDGRLWPLLILIKLVKVAYYLSERKKSEIKHADKISLILFLFWAIIITHGLSIFWLSLRGIDFTLDSASNYINSLYWVITTLTTIGYGDITPVGNVQRLFAIVVEIMGVGLYGYIIGNVAALLSKKDPAKAHYLENMERLSALAKLRKISKPLQKKVQEYFEYVWRNRMGYDETTFLENLPPGLKTEVSLALKQEVIEIIPLFSEASHEFKNLVAMYLKPFVLTPGDILFKEGDKGSDMYFVISGKLEVIKQDSGKVLAELSEGDYFGEIALFKNQPRTATVKSKTYCDLYYLNKSTFESIISRHPAVGEKIEQKIQQLQKENSL